MPPRCLAIIGALSALACASPIAAQTSTPSPVQPSVDVAQPPTAPQARSPWDVTTTLRASAGWRENVTVSSIQRIDRAFWRGEAEAFVLRPVGTKWEFLSFLDGDVLRYLSPPPGVAGEQQWVEHLEGRWQPGPWLRVALKGVGFLQDTFLDPSQTEGSQLPPLRVRLQGAYSTLTPRILLPWGFALEPSVQVKRITYRGYNGDYDEIRPGLLVEWKRSDKLVLSAAWYDHTRHYSHLLASTAGGRLLANHLLIVHEREGELKAKTTFDAGGRWTITASADRLEHRDRAFGNLDYNQDRAQMEVAWERAGWRATVNGDARRLDYLVQQVGTGIVRPHRIADIYEASARLERDLGPKWTLFAEHRWERNRSNLDLTDDLGYRFSYWTATSLIGIQRAF
jgi:hypothetical protein